jgi:rubrerythrin
MARREGGRAPAARSVGILRRAIAPAKEGPTMAATSDVHLCWVCGHVMREIKCKIICPHCGFTRDCSDP